MTPPFLFDCRYDSARRHEQCTHENNPLTATLTSYAIPLAVRMPTHKPLKTKGTVNVAGIIFPAEVADREKSAVWNGANMEWKIIFRAGNGAKVESFATDRAGNGLKV